MAFLNFFTPKIILILSRTTPRRPQNQPKVPLFIILLNLTNLHICIRLFINHILFEVEVIGNIWDNALSSPIHGNANMFEKATLPIVALEPIISNSNFDVATATTSSTQTRSFKTTKDYYLENMFHFS